MGTGAQRAARWWPWLTGLSAVALTVLVASGWLIAAAWPYIATIGRTSMLPWLAPGQRAAHDSAASRSATSIR